MNIVMTPTKEDNLLIALGISEQRAEEIKEIMNRTQEGSGDLVNHMIQIQKEVTLDNEMAFAIFQLGAHAAEVRPMKEDMLGRLKKLKELLSQGKDKEDSISDKLD